MHDQFKGAGAHLYAAYGLVVASAVPLPELVPLARMTSAADIVITLGALPDACPAEARQIGPYLWATPDVFHFRVPRIARFRIAGGREIVVDPDPAGDMDGVRTFLLGTALGVVLAQRGHLMLHGNAVRVGDGCVVCVGPSGAGKSTLAAGFVRRGHQMLADDLVMVDDALCVTPGVPRIKLWADMTRALAIDTAPLRRVRPNLEKFSYPVRDALAAAPVPIRAIYVLVPSNGDSVSVRPVQGFAKFPEIRGNTYRPQFVKVMAMRERYLAMCARLASQVPVARIARPMTGFTLDALIDAILHDLEAPR